MGIFQLEHSKTLWYTDLQQFCFFGVFINFFVLSLDGFTRSTRHIANSKLESKYVHFNYCAQVPNHHLKNMIIQYSGRWQHLGCGFPLFPASWLPLAAAVGGKFKQPRLYLLAEYCVCTKMTNWSCNDQETN